MLVCGDEILRHVMSLVLIDMVHVNGLSELDLCAAEETLVRSEAVRREEDVAVEGSLPPLRHALIRGKRETSWSWRP